MNTKTMKTKVVASIGAAALAGNLFATSVEISNGTGVSLEGDTDSITAVTWDSDGAVYPSSVGNPLFWVDCADTNGWVIGDGGNVSRIPSKAGSTLHGTRYLSVESEGGDWSGWGEGLEPLPPVLVTDVAALNGGSMLDFGNGGSRRALMFSPDGQNRNALTGIGTVITVWGSANGGGHILGGGATVDYGWHRGQNFVNDQSFHYSGVLMNGNGQPVVRNGYSYIDGYKGGFFYRGMNGAWQTISFQCTEAGAEASGLGVHDKRAGMQHTTGSEQVAEVLVYDRVLTESEIVLVEMYLERKWFDRSRPGWNGDARLGELKMKTAGFTATVDVPAGETLAIGRVSGGMRMGGDAAPKLRKTGAGTLVFANPSENGYGGEIVVEAGDVSFPALKPTPAVGDLPRGLYARFDASVRDSVVSVAEGGVRYVTFWRNLVADATVGSSAFNLRAPADAQRPVLAENALGTGFDSLDFGVNMSGGRYLQFSTDLTTPETSCSSSGLATLYSLGTIVLVTEPHNGGGTPLAMWSMRRGNDATATFLDPVLTTHSLDDENIPANWGKVWFDGIAWDPARGYRTPGPQVAAFRTVGGNASRFMAHNYVWYAGGARVSEVLIWNRTLTDEEIMKATAYLEAKWLKRSVPGYQVPVGADAPDDVQNLTVAAGTEINVGAGRTVRIGRLSSQGLVVKKGAGTLEVRENAMAEGASMRIDGGEARTVGLRTATAQTEIAPNPVLHVDSTRPELMALTAGSAGDETVLRWNGVGGAMGLHGYTVHRPFLNRTDTINGHPVVDFGRFGDLSTELNGPRWAMTDKPIHCARSIYLVADLHNGGGFFFSDSAEPPVNDVNSQAFLPQIKVIGGKTVFSGAAGLLNEYPWQSVFDGNVYTNGVAFGNKTNPVSTEVPLLIEYHPSSGVPIGLVGRDRMVDIYTGGFRVGEIIVYDRELSPQEKVATRNYLMAKWFNASPQELPENPEPREITVREIKVEGEVTLECNEDKSLQRVTGEGVLTKTGEGDLTIADVSGLDGTIAVAAGTLFVSGKSPYAEPELVENGIIYHADAAYGITIGSNGSYTDFVTSWKSRHDSAWEAVPGYSTTSYYPPPKWTESEADLGGQPCVNMDPTYSCMRFKHNGEYAMLDNIRSLFWVVGSQKGGGFLMGGGVSRSTGALYAWHRGIYWPYGPGTPPAYVGTDPQCALTYGTDIAKAAWHVNGEAVDSSVTGLSGGWDQLSMVVTNDDEYVNAEGFAFDGRSIQAEGASNLDYAGHQRLAEVIVYDRRVSDEERAKIECYLRCKWALGMAPVASRLWIDVAADAVVDFGDDDRYVAGLTGLGEVKATALTVGELVADIGGISHPHVEGAIKILPGQRVTVRDASSSGNKVSEIVILTADAIEDRQNLSTAVIGGELPPGFDKARLRFKGGKLVLKRPNAFFVKMK